MNDTKTYPGSCFCGAVQFIATGDPEVMGYCHCDSCRRWSASPVTAFTLWQPQAVKVTQGEDMIDSFNKNPGSEDETVSSNRKWCKACGGHIFTEHPTMGVTDIYAATIPDLPFEAGVHVHYQETVLPMKDGLPKMQDLPAEAGGSGIELPE